MADRVNDAKSIFYEVIEVEAADRADFLEKACHDDDELRREVEALLHFSDDSDTFLETPVKAIDATSGDAAPGEPGTVADVDVDFLQPCDKPDRIGLLDHYEIIEVIGRGGMGVVLRGLDTKLNRMAAIKVMAPELAAIATARKRFHREAQAAAAVSHDHVVTIFAVDECGKLPYLAMECIVGKSLQELIDDAGTLELAPIVRIGMQIASGLAAAHEQGLVHRDIKPANILLENSVQRVKITDFGLARAIDDVSITRTGEAAGTPPYMSPEQAEGKRVDHRSDLFSLGSVLYAMCTGRCAFRADSTVATLRRICDNTPRPIREVNPEVPEWLVEIVNQLLAKNPDERFQSAAEVSQLLGQHLAHLQQPTGIARPLAPISDTCVQKANDNLPADPLSSDSSGAPRKIRGSAARRWLAAGMVLFVGGLSLMELTGVTHLASGLGDFFNRTDSPVVDLKDPQMPPPTDELPATSLDHLGSRVMMDVGPPGAGASEAAAVDAMAEALASREQRVSKKDWQNAVPAAWRVVELDPTDRYNWLKLGALLAMVGDEEGYRRCCEQVLAQFADTAEAYKGEVTCKVCLILPGVVDVSRLPLQAILTGPNVERWGMAGWLWCTRALVAYRGGDFQLTADNARSALDASTPPQGNALALVLQAMALHQLGQARQAGQSLQDAQTLIEAAWADSQTWPGHSWLDWLIAKTLLREAEALIDGPDPE